MKHINYDEFILKYLPSTALEANDDSELSIKSKIKYLIWGTLCNCDCIKMFSSTKFWLNQNFNASI